MSDEELSALATLAAVTVLYPLVAGLVYRWARDDTNKEERLIVSSLWPLTANGSIVLVLHLSSR